MAAPLLYVLFALTLISWAGMALQPHPARAGPVPVHPRDRADPGGHRHFLMRAVASTHLVGIGTAATLLGVAMLIVALGSLLPAIEDWFGGRREMRMIAPILKELERRQPDVGIGERPRGPLIFRVAERLSLISDALYLEATDAQQALTGRGFARVTSCWTTWTRRTSVPPSRRRGGEADLRRPGIPRSAEGAERREADAAIPGVVVAAGDP